MPRLGCKCYKERRQTPPQPYRVWRKCSHPAGMITCFLPLLTKYTLLPRTMSPIRLIFTPAIRPGTRLARGAVNRSS
jgi:hypothetical protein